MQDILREQFNLLSREEIESLPGLLRDPLSCGFRTVLFVADVRGKVQGFGLLMHFPDLRFCYLDFLSVPKGMTSRGLGGMLYERMRQEARDIRAAGLFYECLPDDPKLCADPEILGENKARLRFYERYGARPIVGTAYENAVAAGRGLPAVPRIRCAQCPASAFRTARTAYCNGPFWNASTAGSVRRNTWTWVVNSIKDGPVALRPPMYAEPVAEVLPRGVVSPDQRITLVVNDRHDIHHIRERGYVEAPVRVGRIRDQLLKTNLFEEIPAQRFPDKHVRDVHDSAYIDYIKKICLRIPMNKSVYPYVFPIRNKTKPPRELSVRAGYYCIDTFTPLNPNAWRAARRAADCALTAATTVAKGGRAAYALVRTARTPCRAQRLWRVLLSEQYVHCRQLPVVPGRVAILDVDYHHGNGTQDIFWERDDVLTVSIHGHPSFAYPYFSGFRDEIGQGPGEGYNFNFPLQERVDGKIYHNVLMRALEKIRAYSRISWWWTLGLDPGKGDPTGTWTLGAKDFHLNGRLIAELRRPHCGGAGGRLPDPFAGHQCAQLLPGILGGALPVGFAYTEMTFGACKGRHGRGVCAVMSPLQGFLFFSFRVPRVASGLYVSRSVGV